MASYLTTVDSAERAKRRRKPGRTPTSFDVARAVGVSQCVSRAFTGGGKVGVGSKSDASVSLESRLWGSPLRGETRQCIIPRIRCSIRCWRIKLS